MDSNFLETESLIRAVYPENRRPDFWKSGKLSSAALKDRNGLSVTRTYDRSVQDTVNWMKKHFKGAMFSLTVQDCCAVQAHVVYCPSCKNEYHSEIHGSQEDIELSDLQALQLARKAKLEFHPNIQTVI